MDQVFYNCRIYNGTESFVGKIGVDVNREYDNLLQAYGLKERFENKVDTNALIAELLGAQIYSEEPSRNTAAPVYQQPHVYNNQPVQQQPVVYNNAPSNVEQKQEPMITEPINEQPTYAQEKPVEQQVPAQPAFNTEIHNNERQNQQSEASAIPLPPANDNGNTQQANEGYQQFGNGEEAREQPKEEP